MPPWCSVVFDRMSVMACELPAGLDLLALKRAAPDDFPLLLESAAKGGKARWDLLLAGGESGLYLGVDGFTRREDGHVVDGRFLDALDHAQARLRESLTHSYDKHEVQCTECGDLPFGGGWALYLGYELAAQIEPTLQLPVFAGSPLVAAALFCPAAVLRDRATERCFAVALPGHEAWLSRLAHLAEATLQSVVVPSLPRLQKLVEEPGVRFIDGVARVHEYLLTGDVFQVNLSRSWHASFDAAPEPAALYAALRIANPAPFAGLFSLPGGSVASSSPEHLV